MIEPHWRLDPAGGTRGRPRPTRLLAACLLAGMAACGSAQAAARGDANAQARAAAPAPARTIRVQADKQIGEAYDYWRVGNYNKPSLLLEANAAREIAEAYPLIREVNLVYLLGGRYTDKDCWFQGVGADGNVRADFTGMIAEL